MSEAQTCAMCGETVSMPYTCKRCGRSYCSSHRLPENHDCPQMLGTVETEEKWFKEELSSQAMRGSSRREQNSPVRDVLTHPLFRRVLFLLLVMVGAILLLLLL